MKLLNRAMLMTMLGLLLIAGEASAQTIHITTLQELQDMENDLDADYVLDNDIDASDTVNWNSGVVSNRSALSPAHSTAMATR